MASRALLLCEPRWHATPFFIGLVLTDVKAPPTLLRRGLSATVLPGRWMVAGGGIEPTVARCRVLMRMPGQSRHGERGHYCRITSLGLACWFAMLAAWPARLGPLAALWRMLALRGGALGAHSIHRNPADRKRPAYLRQWAGRDWHRFQTEPCLWHPFTAPSVARQARCDKPRPPAGSRPRTATQRASAVAPGAA